MECSGNVSNMSTSLLRSQETESNLFHRGHQTTLFSVILGHDCAQTCGVEVSLPGGVIQSDVAFKIQKHNQDLYDGMKFQDIPQNHRITESAELEGTHKEY